MLPPPNGQFESQEELLSHVRSFVKTQGYAVTIKRSRSDRKGEIKNVTSRVEAAHAVLKRCLQSSVGDLELVHRKIVLQIESQARKTHALISSECMKVHHAHRTLLLEPLLHRVSTFALNKIHTEWIKVLSATPDSLLNPCTRTFESTMGLP
ncbi:2169_t:CDS:2, partial [Gigaspora margarita]